MPPLTLGDLLAFLPGWLPATASLLFGLLWGSFLNVVIYRVPRGMSVVRPGSHCPGCGKPVAPYDNVPVFAYLWLRGRARCCGVKMSPRYPLVELLGGFVSLAVYMGLVRTLAPDTTALHALAVYGAYFAVCLGLVACAFIDLEHMILPDAIVLPGVVLGVATATVRDYALTDALIGAALGFALVWLPFIFLYKALLGRTGMGLGDAKLLALAGAWLGWPGVLFTLFGGAIQGTLYALVLRLFGVTPALPAAVQEEIAELRLLAAEGDEEAKAALAEDPLTEEGEDAPARARIPFGPFLILAMLEFLFAREWIEAVATRLLWPDM